MLAGCGDGGRAAEVACQQRLVDTANGRGQRAAPGGDAIRGSFEAMRDAFERMPLEGCTDGQRHQAASMARVAGDLARMTSRLGDVRRAMEQAPALRSDPAFLELLNRLEEFEGRRRVLRKDLERMAKGR
ncbi:MAG TPA: hypothetical protein VEA60_11955 [Allosphingosinicella sp.]|nr:hypothetical protein [Allosphingosinicella sp.]